jgi:hypothetical protein
MRSTTAIFLVASAALVWLGQAGSFAQDVDPIRITIAHFDFVDTSGEVQDQTAKHEKLLRLFEEHLQKTFGEDGRLEIVPMPCSSGRCSLADPGLGQLKSQARTANARYILAGGIHKMSTLIGWAKFVVVDLENEGRVCDRLLTYRGDTPEAWRRSAEFGGKDVIKTCFP